MLHPGSRPGQGPCLIDGAVLGADVGHCSACPALVRHEELGCRGATWEEFYDAGWAHVNQLQASDTLCRYMQRWQKRVLLGRSAGQARPHLQGPSRSARGWAG